MTVSGLLFLALIALFFGLAAFSRCERADGMDGDK